jgi:hypothetical protein
LSITIVSFTMMALRLATRCQLPTANIVTTAASARFLSEVALKRTTNVSKNKKKGKKSGDSEGGREKSLDLIIRALDAKKAKPPAPDAEELARRHVVGRNHVIGRFEQHNAREHDLSCKIAMKQHAIKMLPRNSRLKEKALDTEYQGDEVLPPMERKIPRADPPNPNVDKRLARKY